MMCTQLSVDVGKIEFPFKEALCDEPTFKKCRILELRVHKRKGSRMVITFLEFLGSNLTQRSRFSLNGLISMEIVRKICRNIG